MPRFPSREERKKMRLEKCLKRKAWLAEQRAVYWRDWATRGLPDLPSIPDVFRGQSVFLTGGSGFLGKLLIEKLLRSCPEVKRIYLLLRPKRGVPSQDRMKGSFSQAVFESLLQMYPDALKKVKIVEGDCSMLGLGLSSEDRAELQREVGFVFHVAASIRFDDPIQKAVILNVRGTREVVELAKGMANLKAFVYVSTSFCNGLHCEERIYEPLVDPDLIISAAERLDSFQLSSLTKKLLAFQPNTYTFTKQIAECVVNRARGEVPVFIVRPSIVFPCGVDPLPGWIDNLSGPFGIAAAALKGVVRWGWLNSRIPIELVFADSAVRGMIMAAWFRTTNQRINDGPNAEVLNIVNKDLSMVWADMCQMRKVAIKIAPLGDALRYPRLTVTSSKTKFLVLSLFAHVFYGFIVDSLLQLTGKKPRLMATYRTVHAAMVSLGPFAVSCPYFFAKTDLYHEALVRLKPEDVDAFDTILNFDEDKIIKGCMKYISVYQLKEDYQPEKFKKQLSRLYIVEVVSSMLLWGLILWLLYSFNVPSFAYRKMYSSNPEWFALAEEMIK